MITKRYLRENPNKIFVFGDNLKRVGYGGGALLRDEPNTYGFVTVGHNFKTFEPFEYVNIYLTEIQKLRTEIFNNPNKIYLISKVGADIANEYKIFEKVIEPTIKVLLKDLLNMRWLW